MKKIKLFAGYFLLCAVAFSMLYPFFAMLNLSFAHNADFFSNPGQFIHLDLTLENYKRLFADIPIAQYFLNSLIVALAATVGQVVFSALAGYAFARFNFCGRDVIFLVILITMMIPPQVTIVSQFIITRQLGLYNTHAGLIAMLAFSVYGVFLLRQAMMAVPDSLSESAKIDGCTYYGIFARIIFPLLKPVLVTSFIFSFMWRWDDFLAPLIYLNDPASYPVSYALKMFSDPTAGSDWGAMFAMATLSLIPIFIIFLAFQRYLVEGIASTGIKG